jgi:hypothetical protein
MKGLKLRTMWVPLLWLCADVVALDPLLSPTIGYNVPTTSFWCMYSGPWIRPRLDDCLFDISDDVLIGATNPLVLGLIDDLFDRLVMALLPCLPPSPGFLEVVGPPCYMS